MESQPVRGFASSSLENNINFKIRCYTAAIFKITFELLMHARSQLNAVHFMSSLRLKMNEVMECVYQVGSTIIIIIMSLPANP